MALPQSIIAVITAAVRKFILILFSTFCGSCGLVGKEKTDLIIHNAVIYTVDLSFAKAEAIAVRNGKIIAIGAEHEILNRYSSGNVVDAEKSPVYPGFIDAHCHFMSYGLSLQQLDLRKTRSFSEVLQEIISYAETHPTGWIIGRGWDQNDWHVKNFPDNRLLDSLFPERPVFIKRVDGHAGLANTTALKAAGLNAHTRVPGGILELKNGRLTGILLDNALELLEKIVPEPDGEMKRKALLSAQRACFASGLTTVDDAGADVEDIALYERLHESGELKIRVYAMLSDNKENFEYYFVRGPYKTDRLNVRSFKFYADGALGSRGACLLEPYSDVKDRAHYGLMLREKEYLRSSAEKILQMGFQMNTHCIGDSGNRVILDIYGEVLKRSNDKRWRIEHAQVVHPNDFSLFSKYNIIPSVQPVHATSDMYWAGDRIGSDRLKGAYAYKHLMRQNGMIAIGSDFPVESVNPLHGFYAAVSRKDTAGYPAEGFQIQNALSREEALRGMTLWAAMANFEEDEKGSLEAGKFADFVLLEKDIMTCDLDKVKDIKVKRVYMDGKKVFENMPITLQ